ncbi:MAG TPA: hypothetical protein VK427_07535 [Kofleriaceae bacterium]|nr:hypothetical protein [Kofleriaceae bacterium]
MDDAGKRLELTKELKHARYWILGVGIAMVVFDQIMFQLEVSKYPDAPAELVSKARNFLFLVDGIVLAFFLGMFFLSKYKPLIACVLALVGFWAIHIYVATQDGGSIAQGFLMKIFFTIALVKGIKSARRAEELQTELGKVFE